MEVFKRDAEAIGDGDERIAAAGPVDFRMLDGSSGQRYWNDERLDAGEIVVALELIDSGQLLNGNVVALRDRGERIVWFYAVIAPLVAFVFREVGDALLEEGRSAGGQVELEGLSECRGRRSGKTEQAGVEFEQLLRGHIDKIGSETEIDGVVDGDRITGDG